MDDEDATVEVEDDGFDEEPVVLTNTNPNFIMATYHAVISFFVSYGWSAVVTCVILIIVWSNLGPKFQKWLEKRQVAKNTSDSDPEWLAKRAEEMELARQRMQEKASAVLKREAERRKELEERKQQERLEDYDALKSGKSSHATQRKLGQQEQPQQQPPARNSSKPKPNSLREGYNHMAGPSSSGRYRPTIRRSGGG